MKKRMKKQMAELMEVTVNIGKAMEVLEKVNAAVNAEELKLIEMIALQGMPKKRSGQSGTPVPTGEGSVKYDEETYIINKLLSLEKEHKSLEQKHNCLTEVVGELNMESHTHWWK